MIALAIRPRFYLDIAEEAEGLARRANPETAVRWHAAVKRTIKQLALHPRIGRERPDLRPPGVRSWRVDHFRRWLIFYQIRESRVILLRVRYGMMDLAALEFEE
jgi:plasmid stabilization system protein ParE